MFAKVPPNVIVPVVVIGPPVRVSPFTVPAVAILVTVPAPSPSAAIVIVPSPSVIAIPEPPDSVAFTGSPVVLPITNCPAASLASGVTAPVPLPRSTPPAVKVDLPVPPDPTGSDVSSDSADRSALEPDTITFFHSAIAYSIVLCFFSYI